MPRFCWFYWNLCCWRSTRSSCSRSGCHCSSATGLLWDLKQSASGVSFPHLEYRNRHIGITQRQFCTGHGVAIQMLRNHELDHKNYDPDFCQCVSHPGFCAFVVHVLKLSPPQEQKVSSNQHQTNSQSAKFWAGLPWENHMKLMQNSQMRPSPILFFGSVERESCKHLAQLLSPLPNCLFSTYPRNDAMRDNID